MPGLDEFKNAAKGVVDGMVENAKEAAEDIVGQDLNGDGVVGGGAEDAPIYGDTASVVDTINEIAQDPNAAAGDFLNAAKDAAGSGMGAVAGLAGAAVNKAEELSGKDLNGDGTIAGAAVEAPAEAAAEEVVDAATEEAVDAAADEAAE